MNTPLSRILCVLAFLLSLAACSNGNNADNADTVTTDSTNTSTSDSGNTSTTTDPMTDPGADPDGDGLSNELELNTYHTNINLADTDGDGISDGDEVNELGFNPASNLYRFNPLIADLPTIAVNIDTVPDLVLRYTDSTGTETSVSNSNGGSKVDIDTSSNTKGLSVTLGTEIGVSVGTTSASESKISASVTGSYSITETDTTENHETWETVNKNSSSSSRQTDGGSLRVGVSIENISNLTYTLEHLTLVASYLDGTQLKPIATLSYDSAGGGFQPTSFAPGEKSNTLLFSFDNLDLGTALDVLKDARSLVVEPALYELTDIDGKPIDFNKADVDTKTAFVLLDYGIVRPQERYHVSLLNSLGDGDGSLDVATVLSQILNVDYQASSGLDTVRGIGGDPHSRWVMVLTHNDGFIDNTTVYDPNTAAYDPAQINLFPGDAITIVYLNDEDDDGIGIREEILNGTDPKKADTDGDGVTDDVEIRNAYLVNANNLVDPLRYPAWVKSNPVLADADGDGLNDGEERQRGLDANNDDTDGDGIGDFSDHFNGQLPVAGDFTLTATAKDAVVLTGAATAKAGTQIVSITVDWGDASAQQTATGTTASLHINLNHAFATPADSNVYTITIDVTGSDGSTATYVGGVNLYKEVNFAEYTSSAGWQENLHIRELADVDADGDLDIVGFGGSDVQVSLWNGTSFGPKSVWLANNYGSASAGGSYSKTEDPRFVIDYDGDGLKDIVAYSPDGIVWSKNTGGAFADPTLIKAAFGSNSGWTSARHVRTLADVDGNGTPDFVAFGATKVFTYLSGGVATDIIEASNKFVYGTGWDTTKHYRFVKDVDGDGKADIVAFGTAAMMTALGQSDGTFADPVIFKSGSVAFVHVNGWNPVDYPIYLEDINNDGKLDIVGFGASAIQVMLNNSTPGNVVFSDPLVWSSAFSRNTGWELPYNKNPRFVTDINNDGYKDLVGFGNSYAFAAENLLPKGKDELDSNLASITSIFNIGSNWQSGGLYNSRYAVDVNQDGRADLVGFGNAGVITQRMPAITQPVEQL